MYDIVYYKQDNVTLFACLVVTGLIILSLLMIYVIGAFWKENILFAIWLESHLLRAYLFVRTFWLCICLMAIFMPSSFEFHYLSLCMEFDATVTQLEGLSYDFTFSDLVSSSVYCILPTAYAEEGDMDLTTVHASFASVQGNNTPGGTLIKQVLSNLVKQLGNDLPIYLTPKGVEAATTLTNMLNTLLESDKFKSDAKLFPYLSDNVTCTYKVHFDITSPMIKAYDNFTLPLKTQQVPNVDDSGVYGFFFNSGNEVTKVGLGSSISCRARLIDHMASFNDHRTQQYMHSFVMANGGLNNLTWSPLITSPNLVHNWNISNISSDMSLGASKVLRGFAQFPLRVLEQGMMDKYSPALNPSTGDVIYFNFSYLGEDFGLPLSSSKQYLAFDSTMTKVLAQSDSYNSLGKLIGLSNVSVRNNMNWHLGVDMVIDGKEVSGYLREPDVPLRSVPIHQQVHPKGKLPSVELSGRTLYDLVPGKLHAISTDTLSDFGLYDNERHLWTSLNPSTADKLSAMSTKDGKSFLNNRVGRYMNIARSNTTELGDFYFCRHPEHLAGLAKAAEALFVINMVTGACNWFANISQVSRSNRTGVRRHLVKGTLHNDITRYVVASDLVNYIPEAKEVKSMILTKEQLNTVRLIPGSEDSSRVD